MVYWPPFRGFDDEVPRKQRMRYAGPFKVISVPSQQVVELEGLPQRMPKYINLEYIHLYKRDTERWKELLRNPFKR